MKKRLFAAALMLLVLCLAAGCEKVPAEPAAQPEQEDMRLVYNPEGYEVLYVTDVFTGEEGLQAVQGTFGKVDMEEGEDDIGFIGFDPEKTVTLTLAEGAVIEMPEDVLSPMENSPLSSFEELEAWFDGFLGEVGDWGIDGFHAIFEMNEAGELTSLEYLYMP